MLKPAVSGFLMEQELQYLGEALHKPKRPFVAVLGGAKISGKIDLIEALLPKVDAILLGGAMACTFFAAMGLETGNSLVEDDRVELARDTDAEGRRQAGPAARRGHRAELESGAETRAVARDAIPAGLGGVRHRPGHREATSPRGSNRPARWCGTGRWACSRRRRSITARWRSRRAMAAATGRGAVTVVGGGDSAAAVAQAGLDAPDDPRVDRRWRVARVPRGQGRCPASPRSTRPDMARARSSTPPTGRCITDPRRPGTSSTLPRAHGAGAGSESVVLPPVDLSAPP